MCSTYTYLVTIVQSYRNYTIQFLFGTAQPVLFVCIRKKQQNNIIVRKLKKSRKKTVLTS